MNKLFDKRQIVDDKLFTESYIGYGKNDLAEMTEKDLRSELKMVEEDIKNLTSEIEDADSYPSFALKERLENANWYRDKIMNEIDDRKKSTNSFESDILNQTKKVHDMINDLKRQYEKGQITEEYRDKYIDKLENSIKDYEDKLKQEKIIDEERQKREKSKHHIFKTFKKKLKDYKK